MYFTVSIQFLSIAITFALVSSLRSETVEIGSRSFVIPKGYELKNATELGLTERPIVVDFDHDGNLYVAESSGTNDNVQKQLREKPHSILRLSDTDNDGVFDKRTVFADRMMFPEGVLWHRGSVYVGAPPQIWKLTDTDGDGVADEREVWFDAKTLTGCANDLHGPYLGLDGWIYWCKGAFAEQTYERGNGRPLVTRAAHIFRRRPEGGLIEPVMTGGMDNPVEVVFTQTGERIFTTTFFQHPANGQRDGLVHAIYGGVYGKRHGVIDGHARTGELMPVMTHLGAAAPSGLARLESNALGFESQLLSACFNLHSVKRHELIPHGATFQTNDSDLVSSDDLDFHPTDVIEDADGSVLVVDTGGWYKLCCPTSQLHKPDVAGGIYRLTKLDSGQLPDPRGRRLPWKSASNRQLADWMSDDRFSVRRRAMDELALRGSDATKAIRDFCFNARVKPNSLRQVRATQCAIWSACRIDSPEARELVRDGLQHHHADVRQVAAHAVGVWRDAKAVDRLIALLGDRSLHTQRAAAEALGRIGDATAIPDLLARLDEDIDRTLEHSLIYALIEVSSPEKLREVLASGNVKQRRAALIALQGIPGDHLSEKAVLKLLQSRDSELRLLATRVAKQHPEWSKSYVALFRRELRQDRGRIEELSQTIGALSGQPIMDRFVAELLAEKSWGTTEKSVLLRHIAFSKGEIEQAFEALLRGGDVATIAAVVLKLDASQELSPSMISELTRIASTNANDAETRLLASRQLKELNSELFPQVVGCLSAEHPARVRSLAVNVLENTELREPQLVELAEGLTGVGALELSRLLRVFEKTKTKKVGEQLFRALSDAPVATALPPEQLASLAGQFGDSVQELARPLLETAATDASKQAQRLTELMDTLPQGDIRRGQKLFHDQKLACFTCHTVGYRGGTVGPDLSRIGRTRSRRDLLEAIMYPSASFVRSYEPVNVLAVDGRQWSGTIRDQSSDGLELQLNATESKMIDAVDIDEILPGRVSIMPAGLDKQLAEEQLADLLAFLESRK